MNTRCVVVIGHVDHGKTALTRALTGIETDRTAQEQARGLSIVPGFAHKAYPNGVVDFVDAPGHEDFLAAMVSGASGAQAAMLVISATEGICTQTHEHLSIAGLLGISQGVIAVTKSDLLPPSQHAQCLSSLRAALSNTVLADAPMVLCSAHSGDGIAALEQALQVLLEKPAMRPAPPAALLPVDRVFTLAGSGTIVTGTLLGDAFTVGQEVTLQPSGQRTTLRALQCRGEKHDTIDAGIRVAANLRGVAVADVSRGDVVCAQSAYGPSDCFDIAVQLLPSAPNALKHMESVRVLFGTTNAVATIRLLGGGKLVQGDTALAQLRFASPVLGYAGQRMIIRRLSPAATLGGAVVLDPQAKPTRAGDTRRVAVLEAARSQSPIHIADALCGAHRGIAALADIARLSRLDIAPARDALGAAYEDVTKTHVAQHTHISDCKAEMLDLLATYHAHHPLAAMAPPATIDALRLPPALQDHVKDALRRSGQIRTRESGLALATHDPVAQLTPQLRQQMHILENAYRTAMLTSVPPPNNPLDRDLIALLIQQGLLLGLRNIALNQTVILHADTLGSAAANLLAAFPPSTPFTTSQARNVLNTSRKIIVPVLEYFDTCAVTLRHADARQMTGELPVPPAAPNC